MAFESPFEVTSLEFPNFDGAIIRGGGDLSVLRMEGERGDVGLVACECEFGWSFRYVDVFDWSGGAVGFLASFLDLLLKVLHFIFQVVDLLLE